MTQNFSIKKITINLLPKHIKIRVNRTGKLLHKYTRKKKLE